MKVDKSRLTKKQQEVLFMMFVEAKWCYNYLLNKMEEENFDIFKFNSKELDTITHKDKDKNDVQVTLNYLTSSLKCFVVDDICSHIKTLNKLKKKGDKVGKLSFISEYKSLKFKQYGLTHSILSKNKIKLQGIKKPLVIHGLKQIDKYGSSYEITSAMLNKRDNNYYVYVTVFYNDEQSVKDYLNEQIAIDFGCQTSLTFSDGTKVNAIVEEPEKLTRLMNKLRRQVKHSNNYRKTLVKIHKVYQKSVNKKDDLANKIVHRILSENEQIIIQDEQLNVWKHRHGKVIQHGVLGRVKEKLKQDKRVVVLSKFIPTTKFCYNCGNTYNISLYERTYTCPNCNHSEDRDNHAANNMLWIYNNLNDKIGLGESEFKRVDFDNAISEFFQKSACQSEKHEDAISLG